ncbi:hypothetical protein GCM10011409_18890 [Lentibacillus populi]|uniref:Uncharacterized protein n=1 Tax=Lentibacillus populi TaxID=1827502 RepID=A0A9W5X5C4_9BACI|nr:hypothetical protein [Lentibacillus populi]GGB41596.1 hypothetical protein GCM10011409_18890 [Lentibacillus populi]
MNIDLIVKESCGGFWNCLNPSDILQLVAVIIAMLAAIASWFSIFVQARINKKDKESIIVPGIKEIEANITYILSDWDVNEKLPKKFSNTTLPIWNYGNTPVFNIGYCYYIENLDYFLDKEDLNEGGKIIFGNHSLKVRKDENGKSELFIRYEFEGQKGAKRIQIAPFIRSVDLIDSNDKTEIYIPDYFIYLLNDYFINSFFEDKTQPRLLLKVFYDDINFQSWEQQFRIFIPNTYSYKGEDLITSLHYEVVQKKKKRKRLTIEENEKRMEKRRKRELKKVNK